MYAPAYFKHYHRCINKVSGHDTNNDVQYTGIRRTLNIEINLEMVIVMFGDTGSFRNQEGRRLSIRISWSFRFIQIGFIIPPAPPIAP
jgi:hypothetical protein